MAGTVLNGQITKREKPLMEKRRRARINESLAKLKLLVLGEVRRKTTRVSKLDKADILDMTVEYAHSETKKVQCLRNTGSHCDKYRVGFNACAEEVWEFLSTLPEVDVELRTRITEHLASFIQNVHWIKNTSSLQEEGTNQIDFSNRKADQSVIDKKIIVPQGTPHSAVFKGQTIASSPCERSDISYLNSSISFPAIANDMAYSVLPRSAATQIPRADWSRISSSLTGFSDAIHMQENLDTYFPQSRPFSCRSSCIIGRSDHNGSVNDGDIQQAIAQVDMWRPW